MKKIKKFIRKNQKLIIIVSTIILAVILGLIVFLCTKDKPKETTKTKEVQNNVVEETKKATIIDEDSKSRPYAVMIDNSADARAVQRGVQKAYMVYEVINYVDGRTRFMALYKDADVKEIAPIRSSRHYYLDYVLENDAIYVHWGYSPQAQADIKTLGINNINGLIYGDTYFWTPSMSGVSVSHRRFTSTELMTKGANKFGYRATTEKPNLFKYSGKDVINNDNNSVKADNISIYYSSKNYTSYTYDANTGLYLKSSNGKSHVDHENNKQLTVKNIITYKIKNSTIPGDDSSRQELANIGSGEGYYITNGYATKINWKKDCRECQTEYTYTDGSKVELNDGNTFINIQPSSQELKIS